MPNFVLNIFFLYSVKNAKNVDHDANLIKKKKKNAVVALFCIEILRFGKIKTEKFNVCQNVEIFSWNNFTFAYIFYSLNRLNECDENWPPAKY